MAKPKWFMLITLATLAILTFAVISAAARGDPEEADQILESDVVEISNQLLTLGEHDIRINEVMFYPDSGSYEWVELKNTGAMPLLINGFGLTDEDGNWYNFPSSLPAVPSGGFVVVIFDGVGVGSDDYDFSDNVATLHSLSGVVDIFENDQDQVALYQFVSTPTAFLPIMGKNFSTWDPYVPGIPPDFPESALIDFVAWGGPPETDAEEANVAGIWNQEWYVGLQRGLGIETPGVSQALDETIGLLPDSTTSWPEDWVLYQTGETTQGAENPYPTISWYYPDAGTYLGSDTFSVGWNLVTDATGYQFQLDDQSDFGSPVVDETLTEPAYIAGSVVADGTYYWRVKVRFPGAESPWSPGVEINTLTLPPPLGTRGTAEIEDTRVLGITWQQQHKDTSMICLDGDNETGNQPWNAEHTVRGIHGRNYCARASIAMLASYYGGDLSQDRITYEIFKGGAPEGDLGHDIPISYAQADTAVNWALGQAVARINGKPTFAQIKTWIDANQPLGSTVPGHMRIIDGYAEFTLLSTTWRFLHVLDPWDRAKWVRYEDDNLVSVWPAPAGTNGAPNVKSDDDVDGDNVRDTIDDSDTDGVVDFDERNRFNLNVSVTDTDNDQVPDLPDIREYVFDINGNYSKRNADPDFDGDRKEIDPDNDQFLDNGAMDGCEDTNFDGKYESTLGETDNFKPSDDMRLHIRLTWPLLGSDVDLHLINPGGSYQGVGDCYFGNRNPDWGIVGLTCDNPTLDVDCITSCTIENIRLSKLENGTYTVLVHYWWDHDLGPTNPRVTMWLSGTRYDFGPRTISDGDIWTVATIDWPSGTVTAGGVVTHGNESMFASEKGSP